MLGYRTWPLLLVCQALKPRTWSPIEPGEYCVGEVRWASGPWAQWTLIQHQSHYLDGKSGGPRLESEEEEEGTWCGPGRCLAGAARKQVRYKG